MVNSFISASGLRKKYRLGNKDVWALNGLDFSITSGEMVVLIGRSGSGKTTLLNLLGGLDWPTEGSLFIDGLDASKMSDRELTRFRGQKIGYVFQTFNLIPVLTVLENIEYPFQHQPHVSQSEKRERSLVMIERVGLADFAHQRPSRLSGGQRQRVAIARALVHRPLLVMADEPTANLDSQTAADILNLMFELNQEFKQTFIIASHDPAVIQTAKRTLRLADGRLEP